MRLLLKILGMLIFYAAIFAVAAIAFVLSWSYGEKKKIPSKFLAEMESVFEDVSPDSQMFIGAAEVEFVSFSEGFGVQLENSYIQFGKNAVASIPKITIKLKLTDLLTANIKFREINLDKPKFVISGNVGAEDFSDSASENFFNLYKVIVYGMFDKIDRNENAFPAEKIDLNEAEFSFNKGGTPETWQVSNANLRFFTLQNTTYLSTYVKTKLFGKNSEITTNARLLEKDRVMLKVEYKNLASRMVTGFIKELDWFNNLKPIMNGTASVVMERDGKATTFSLDTDIQYKKKEFADTRIGFKGIMDLSQDDEGLLKPKVHGEVYLKDVNMEKLPALWPEKYGGKVREDVLKNYTKGTFNNVSINFDFVFADSEFTKISSEKYSIAGNIVDTDVIYNPNFPAVEKVDGHFVYDGDSVQIDMKKGKMGGLEFGPSKVSINGLTSQEKTILEIDGTGKGDLMSLRPLLKSILKGRDKEFFYNTRDIKANADMKFYYKDNIHKGFDHEYLKLDIVSKLSDVEIKNVIKGIDLTSQNLNMNITNDGLAIQGDANINGSPSQVKVRVGFVKDNDVELNLVAEANSEVLAKYNTALSKFVDGELEIEFEYKSDGDRNYFAGKVDSVDAAINVPYFSWKKPKGVFASISLGGKYISGKAIEVSELQIVSSDSISTGNLIVSLSKDIADEVYFSRLTLGNNDAELYFNRSVSANNAQAYVIKINGRSFNASELINSFHQIASGNNALVLDMSVDNLSLANDVNLKNTKAFLRCGQVKCYQGNFNADITAGGKISGIYKPEDSDNIEGVRNFEITSDNAGAVVKGFGFSDNIESGYLLIQGSVGADATNEANGIIEMRDFKLKKAPILTKVFSLASFTGLLNILSDSGVPMEKLKGVFKMKNDYISISDLRAHGNSLGFTTQGNINLKDSAVDLTGAVTPSYQVNSMLGRVPVLGALFKGNEGEGLIATSYSVKGKYPNVEVSVNPLSVLTPGFLRKIWGEAETDIDKKTQEKPQIKTNIKQKGFPVNVIAK